MYIFPSHELWRLGKGICHKIWYKIFIGQPKEILVEAAPGISIKKLPTLSKVVWGTNPLSASHLSGRFLSFEHVCTTLRREVSLLKLIWLKLVVKMLVWLWTKDYWILMVYIVCMIHGLYYVWEAES
jgi:hypothetical protein